MNNISKKISKICDSISRKARCGQDNVREWIYTYLFESVSMLEVFDFGSQLALVRECPATHFMLWLTKLVHKAELSIKQLLKKK